MVAVCAASNNMEKQYVAAAAQLQLAMGVVLGPHMRYMAGAMPTTMQQSLLQTRNQRTSRLPANEYYRHPLRWRPAFPLHIQGQTCQAALSYSSSSNKTAERRCLKKREAIVDTCGQPACYTLDQKNHCSLSGRAHTGPQPRHSLECSAGAPTGSSAQQQGQLHVCLHAALLLPPPFPTHPAALHWSPSPSPRAAAAS